MRVTLTTFPAVRQHYCFLILGHNGKLSPAWKNLIFSLTSRLPYIKITPQACIDHTLRAVNATINETDFVQPGHDESFAQIIIQESVIFAKKENEKW